MELQDVFPTELVTEEQSDEEPGITPQLLTTSSEDQLDVMRWEDDGGAVIWDKDQ